jgi:Protein of unknown function (DUF3455)
MNTARKILAPIALQLALALLASVSLASAPKARADDTLQPPDLSFCPNLQVPAGNVLKFHAYGIGVQIYQWNGTSWVFVGPSATLYADSGYHGQVGVHFAGPTWESNSGSKVVGRRLAACTPDSNSIPWLLLISVSSQGPGVLNNISYVQRLNTVGGNAPGSAGTTVGQMAQVPYTAEYFFYSEED